VSVRCGDRYNAGEIFYKQLKGRQHCRLHVEDPCDNTRNLNCVLGKLEELQLYEAFKDAWVALQGGKAPVGLGAALRTQHGQPYRQPHGEVGLALASKDAAAAEGQALSESTMPGSYCSGAESTASGSESPTAVASPVLGAAPGLGGEASECDLGTRSGSGRAARRSAAAPAATGKKVIECGDLEAALLASQTQVEERMESAPWWQQFMDSGAAVTSAKAPVRRKTPPPEEAPSGGARTSAGQGAHSRQPPAAAAAEKPGTWYQCGDLEAKIVAAKVRPGDWTCHSCGAMVFGSKVACFKCGAPKPEAPSPAPGAAAKEAANQTSGQGQREVRRTLGSRMGRNGCRARHTDDESPAPSPAGSPPSSPPLTFQ
jgi:hypothetical protein